jgi:hypothetical protein
MDRKGSYETQQKYVYYNSFHWYETPIFIPRRKEKPFSLQGTEISVV